MSIKAAKKIQQHLEIEFLKTLTYEEINDIMNQLNDKINDLENQLQLLTKDKE